MRHLLLMVAALGAWAVCGSAVAGDGARLPNVVFVLIDDIGYGDFSCNGNPILKTPNMDKLHDAGVRFTNFHVSPTCAPTRSALLSGRHEFKNGITHTIYERERMSLKTVTLAQVLKSAGYTTGIFGKWHLGDEDAYQPEKRGFDEVFIHGCGGIGQHFPGSGGDVPGNSYFSPTIKHNGTFEKTEGYCTDVFFAQAEKWMESQKGGKPFFCYIPTNAAHMPLNITEEYAKIYAGKVKPDVAKFFGMIANIDDNVGRMMGKLKEWGIERETLVVVMNDNGGTVGCRVFNAGMRGEKCTQWEGGTRAASFWVWPGHFKPADVGALTAHIDFLPTIAELAGAKLDETVKAQVEGRSLVPLLEDAGAAWPERTLVTHVGRWKRDGDPEKLGECSIRDTQYSLVYNDDRWELFDLKADPGQRKNVAAEHADVVARLTASYDQWWLDVQPLLVNEHVMGPAVNPYKEQYLKQFGKAAEVPPGSPKSK